MFPAASARSEPVQDRAVRTRLRILGAATAVIQREGASNLTLDKVAEEAQVSKGGLLYHFGSKDELIVGLLDQTLAAAGSELEDRVAAAGSGPGSFALAYLDYVRRPYQEATDSASSILAAAALDDRLLAGARGTFVGWQDRLLDDGLSPVTALLARIVGDGLWLIDLFGLAPPTAAQRTEVLDLVERLIAAEVGAEVRAGGEGWEGGGELRTGRPDSLPELGADASFPEPSDGIVSDGDGTRANGEERDG